jgi:hypothetical protein
MWQALHDWENYLNDQSPRLPLLVRSALLHYQFETIHPFLGKAMGGLPQRWLAEFPPFDNGLRDA